MVDAENGSYQQHDVPIENILKWQKTVDLMAAIFDVPAGLIMRVLPTQIEVLLASNSSGNPYKVGEKADLNTGLYCETVMAEQEQLAVPNALDDPQWKDNPDVPLNMISYLGVPLICPDGSVFGTICVLDDHTRNYLPLYNEMLSEFRSIIEQDLQMLEQDSQLRLANKRLTHELAVARELSDAADRKHRLWLQGSSIAVRALRESIEALANNDDPVLLTGPNGAGQEAVARAIHRDSPRSKRPFIYVACPHVSATDDTAYGFNSIGSDELSAGKISLADGGTLYLEGIEALSPPAQESLLRFLKDVASDRAAGRQPKPDVRIISFTSVNMPDAVQQGGFKNELAKILGTRRLSVPSLADRQDDVVSLANSIVLARARSLGKTLTGLNPQSEEMLREYSWPGNLSELQSVVERSVVLASGSSVNIPVELLQEGRRVGGYTLERQLGAGAMGEVWLAKQTLLARPSAIKLIRQDAMVGDASLKESLEQRFRREAEATAKLRSPHTVELYDFGVTEEGDFYYVMEFLNGVDLESLVTQFGPIGPGRAVFLLSQACMSLGEAHDAGLVHRDVKPANLFTCSLGPHYDFLKLLDFGIVRTTDNVSQTLTSAGQITGTPTSLAPEVIQGHPAEIESDIYGLGCVAYWLLTGKHVFDAPHIMALFMQHVSQPPKPISEHRSGIPVELEELVLRCLKKNPKDRPSSAFELAESLASLSLDTNWNSRDAADWWSAHMASMGDEVTPTNAHDGTIIFDSN
ncbi:sigma 54-interacting transcriptional regulator [Planctomicrobium sp.]|nr:sigma 54-interacting transcriptional regulator [Planctomicrobium sp.]MDB4743390.1 sigma 54-interacting transcriptional regulator [Planctomicrobium sp.]